MKPYILLTRLIVVAVAAGLSACTTIQRNPVKVASSAYAPANHGILAEVSEDFRSRTGSGESGFHLLTKGEEALKWRLALIDHAVSSIDVQYYLWDDDEIGHLVLARLLEAARRGVRVRILVDDFLFTGNEDHLATVCHHPNFDVRIFNPNIVRTGTLGKIAEYVIDFKERNRRMHNKLFVVDNQLAIMGGRNIGNPYFGISEKYNFLDLDVLTTGAIVPEISAAFDNFWNSDPAYPGKAMSLRGNPEKTDQAIDRFLANFAADPGILPQTNYPLQRRDWSSELRSLRSSWRSGQAKVVQDEPVITKGAERERFLKSAPKLVNPDNPTELFLVTPYLIPNNGIYRTLSNYQNAGAPVTFVVPGLDSNNQPLVHSHYKKYRRSLLAHGVSLYEIRSAPSADLRRFNETGPARGASTSLHLKGAIADGQKCFIGSLNLDPRSIEINTENGLFIHSTKLAADLKEYFRELTLPENAWHVTTEGADGEGPLLWRSDDEELTRQPSRGTGSRISDFFFGILPVESLL
jgi:putative cardiolipin synthase